MVKQWKENPPGEDQIVLDNMFKNGEIEENESAAYVQSRVPRFKVFTEKNFASHFNKTRARHGYGVLKSTACNDNDKIPELGGSGHGTTYVPSADSWKIAPSTNEGKDTQFKNAPYIVWVYADHGRQCEIVCVAVPIISGARDVDFFLSEDNITLNVTYVWPAALTNPTELFKKQLSPGGGGWTMSHPKIYSFMSRLHEMELSVKSRPPASIVIKLPVKVQRETNTYGFAGVKTTDGNVVMLEFQSFQKFHVIADINTKIIFE